MKKKWVVCGEKKTPRERERGRVSRYIYIYMYERTLRGGCESYLPSRVLLSQKFIYESRESSESGGVVEAAKRNRNATKTQASYLSTDGSRRVRSDSEANGSGTEFDDSRASTRAGCVVSQRGRSISRAFLYSGSSLRYERETLCRTTPHL